MEAYVGALQDAYVRLRRRWRPSYRSVGPEQQQAWYTMGSMFARANREGANIDPYEYAEWVFSLMTRAHDDVYPNMFCSPKLVRQYMEEKPELDEALKLLIQLQGKSVKRRIDDGENLRDILLDKHAELSAVFRAAAANHYGHHDLLERFKPAATEMLIFKPLYKTLLKDWLPKDWLNV